MIFENGQEFVNKFNPLIFQEQRTKYPNITRVGDLFSAIHKGCGCTRNKRIELANNNYKGLNVSLSEEEKAWIKENCNNEEVVFKDNGQIFLTIP